MAVVLKDRVQETTGVVGTGTMTLAGAVVGFQAFSSVGTGSTVYYSITNAADGTWEVGSGTYTLSGTTLSRDTVYSSSAAGAKVSFAAGTKQVFCTYPASQSIYQASADNYPSSRPTLLLDFANTKVLDPRITFTRASTGAYYDGKTTALAEQNLLTYSQTIGGTGWSNNGTTATLNSIAAPDGTTTASLITETATLNTHDWRNASVVSTQGVVATYSTYMKAGTRTWGCIRAYQGTNILAYFDLTNGVLGSVDAGFSASIVSAGNGWYRCIVTFTYTSAAPVNGPFSSGIASANGVYNYTGDGTSGIYLWGAQLEQRASATAYTPTTTAAITNYIPVLLTAASGAARFDSNPTTGESLGLLIEEQRTNLSVPSVLTGVGGNGWTSVTPNSNIAPDGSLSATRYTWTAFNNCYISSLLVTNTAATAYTGSIYVKANILSTNAYSVQIGRGDSGQFAKAIFNASTNTVSTSTGGADVSNASATVTAAGNSWYRITITATFANSYISAFGLSFVAMATNGDAFIWGAQLEAGSFATSYIPTTTTQVTRAADSASMTGTNFSSWYNQSAGTFYAESNKISSTYGGVVAVTDGTGNNSIQIYSSGGSVQLNMVISGTSQFDRFVGNYIISVFYRVSLAYSTTTYAGSNNGAPAVQGVTSNTPLVNRLLILQDRYGGPANGTIKRIAYYPVALTSTQLQALTS